MAHPPHTPRSPAEVAARYDAVLDGVQQFLAANDLDVSEQRLTRIARHVLTVLDGVEPLAPFAVFNHLQNIFEYNELVANAMDADAPAPAFAEEALVHLIVSAETREPRARLPLRRRAGVWLARARGVRPWKKALAAAVLLACLALPGFMYTRAAHEDAQRHISVLAARDLSDMVARVVALEAAAGREVSGASVWAEVKAHPEVVRHGYTGRYTHFSVAQEKAARRHLAARITRLEAEAQAQGGGGG
jgi:hypothetical protein